MSNNLTLTQSLSSRLCSDFANQLSLISNSAELLNSENEAIKKEALSIIHELSQKMIGLLETYRYGYGFPDFARPTSKIELNELINKYLAINNSSIDFEIITNDNIDIDYALGTIIISFLLSVCNHPSDKGFIEFNILNQDIMKIRIIGPEIHNYRLSEIITKLLSSSRDATIDNCHEHYLKEVIKEQNYILSINQFPEITEFSFERRVND